ncbi:hypothetical protein ACNKHX_26450 [Shigella flexneri]
MAERPRQNGGNRLGSNSLPNWWSGPSGGEQATEACSSCGNGNEAAIEAEGAGVEQLGKIWLTRMARKLAKIATKWVLAMEEGCGIYRTPELMQKTIDKLAELQECFKRVRITDTSSVLNTTCSTPLNWATG